MRTPLARSATALVLACAGIVAIGGTADAAGCTARSTRQAFAQFGDHAGYFVAESGTFENGTSGWSLSRSYVVGDQEPWRINGAGHAKGLRIKPGGTARVTMCVTEVEDAMRFFYRMPGGTSSLRVTMDAATSTAWYRSWWTVNTYNLTTWNVSPRVSLPPLRDSNGQIWISMEFWNTGSQNVVIDDVMIDPWISR